MDISLIDRMAIVVNAVLHASWQGSLLMLVVIGAQTCLGRRIPANLRYAFWLIVFARLATPWVPAASWSLYSLVPTWKSDNSVADTSPSPAAPIPVSFGDGTETTGIVGLEPSGESNRPASTVIPTPSPLSVLSISSRNPVKSKSFLSAAQLLTLMWCAGVAGLLLRLSAQRWLLARRSRRWRSTQGTSIHSTIAKFQSEAQIRRPVTVLLSDDQAGPATCGILKPLIVLPSSLVDTLTPQELRLIVLHELMHVRRRDAMIDLLASIVSCVHWFNPLAWIALSGLRYERELACDAATLALVGQDARKDYGSALLRAVESMQRTSAPAGTVAIFERRWFARSLEHRIRSALAFQPMSITTRISGMLVLTLIVCVGMTDAIAIDKAAHKQIVEEQKAAEPQPAERKTFSIVGTCTDESGKPLADVQVRLYRDDWPRVGQPEPLQEMQTDQSGRYRFSNIVKLSATEEDYTHYTCVLTAPGRASSSIVVRSSDGDQVQSARMYPATTVTGYVRDLNGNPIVGARVWTHGIGEEPVEGLTSAWTNVDGFYAIHDLEPFDSATTSFRERGEGLTVLRMSIRAGHPDFVRLQSHYSSTPTTVDFELALGGVIEGKVFDALTGAPSANALVTVRPVLSDGRKSLQPHQINSRRGMTDAKGNYRFTGLGETSYTIMARTVDRPWVAIRSAPVVAGETQTVPNLELIEGAVIVGDVTDEEGRPVLRHKKHGSRITIEHEGPSDAVYLDTAIRHAINEEGRFRIHVVPGLIHLTLRSAWVGLPVEYPKQSVLISSGETRHVTFRVLNENSSPVRNVLHDELPTPVSSEQSAANVIRELGGSYKLDADGHVNEINLVYHVTKNGQRYENRQLNEKSLPYLSSFTRLNSVYLKESQATDSGFKFVGQLPQLENLTVWDANLIGDAGVRHLSLSRTLKSLYLWDCHVTDEGIDELAKINSLEELYISSDQLTDAAFHHLKHMPRLKLLDMRSNSPFTNRVAFELAQMPALEKLTLVANVTNDGLREMHRTKSLKSLELYSEKITIDGVHELQQAIPDLKVSALDRQFPSRNALREAADPQRRKRNREEGTNGLQLIQRFLTLMTEGKTKEAATLCRRFSCEDPAPSSPEAALVSAEDAGGPAVVKYICSQIKSFADCKISLAYGDSELVIAITTAPQPHETFRRGTDGRSRRVIEPVVLRAVKSHGRWYVDSDDISGTDDPEWRINYLLGDHAGAQKLLP